MAGGKNTRFRGDRPKIIAPLPDGSTLLTRLIAQLGNGRIRDVTICCSPENVSLIVETTRDFPTMQIQARAYPQCSFGPLPALAEALQTSNSSWRLLLLADIYYDRISIADVARRVEETSADGWILAGASLIGPDAGTGWIECDGPNVRGISYQRSPNATTRWTGGFLFSDKLIPALAANASTYAHKPFEKWIHDLICAPKKFRAFDVGGFVNVNSFEDFDFVSKLACRGGAKFSNHAIGAAHD